jgi:hypothetical protein
MRTEDIETERPPSPPPQHEPSRLVCFCENCNASIGYVAHDVLHTITEAGDIVETAAGAVTCHRCGYRKQWDMSERGMRRLLGTRERAQRRRTISISGSDHEV